MSPRWRATVSTNDNNPCFLKTLKLTAVLQVGFARRYSCAGGPPQLNRSVRPGAGGTGNTMKTIIIREATSADIPALARLP
jgi:hypothetical protein